MVLEKSLCLRSNVLPERLKRSLVFLNFTINRYVIKKFGNNCDRKNHFHGGLLLIIIS